MKQAYSRKRAMSVFGTVILAVFLILMGGAQAHGLETINLPPVNKDRRGALMTALSNKASANSLSERNLSLQDLSDLLWAAAGINRPNVKKRTFSTAMNTQDTELYLLMKDGAYVYDYENHALNPVTSGDYRMSIALKKGRGKTPAGARPKGGDKGAPAGKAAKVGRRGDAAGGPPAGAGARKRISTFAFSIIIVSDPPRYRAGTDDLKAEWGAFSAGGVAQNIMLFCTANNLGTRPRAAFDKGEVRKILKLKDTQNPIIELPIGYPDN